jgi:hypothetical protein
LLTQQTSIIIHRLPNKENKLSVFHLQITNRIWRLFSVCSKKMEVAVFCLYIEKRQHTYRYIDIYIEIYILISIYVYLYICIYIFAAVSNRKRKPRRFSLIRLPFTHRSNEVCHLFMKKQTQVICLQTD